MKGFFASSAIQKERPDVGLVAKCGACQLFKKCESPKMPVYGDGRRGVLIVGESPGEDEDEGGRPFLGQAGRYLRDVLDELGVDLDRDAWSTNALICRSRAVPDIKQIGYCYPNLASAIELYNPLVVVALGRVALTSVLRGYWDEIGSMARWTGWRIPLAKHWVCPTYHPSFLLRSRNEMMDRLFAQDLKRAFSIKQPPPPLEDYRQQIELLVREEEVVAALREFDRQGGWLAVDYETNCLKPEYPKAVIKSCAVSNGSRTVSYPWHGASMEATSRLLRSERTMKIAANLKFEERWTKRFLGHPVARWGWDTMLATHVLDNREGICSLKFQSLVTLGVPVYNQHIDPYLSSGKDSAYNQIANEISLTDLLFYGGMDAILEYRLAMRQRKKMGYE